MNPKRRGHTSTGNLRGVWHAVWLAGAPRLLYLAGIIVFSAVSAKGQQKVDSLADPAPTVDPRLLQAKRVCIGEFGKDVLGVQAREMIIAPLFDARRDDGSKRYILIDADECKDVEADLTLKGSITEQREQTHRSESEGVSFNGRGASGSGHENLSSSETKVHAVVTLRLVNKEGQVLWAISHESTGGKTKGAIGDAADRAARRLLRDIERAEKEAVKEDSKKGTTNQPKSDKPPTL